MSATNYKNKQQKESAKRDFETYKMNLISDIYNDINEKGLSKIEEKETNKKYTLHFCNGNSKNLEISSDSKSIIYGNNYSLKNPNNSNINKIELITAGPYTKTTEYHYQSGGIQQTEYRYTRLTTYNITINIEDQLLVNQKIKLVLSSFKNETH